MRGSMRLLLAASLLAQVSPASAQTPGQWPADAVALSVGAGGPAPWLEALRPRTLDDRYPGVGTVERGYRHTLVVREHGAVLIDHASHDLRTLELPAHDWIGFAGDDDTLWLATDARTLSRARPPYETWEAIPTPQGLPALRGYSSAGDCVLVWIESEIWLSLDAGETFALTKPNRDEVIDVALCRYDGAVAAQLHESGETWLFVDGEWLASPLQPASIVRNGGVIRANEGDPFPMLSADRRSWSDELDWWDLRNAHVDPADMLSYATRTEGYPAGARWLSISEPSPPPPDPTPPIGLIPEAGYGSLFGSGTGGGGLPCRGLECIHGSWGPEAFGTRYLPRLASNARCVLADADDGNRCADGSDWERAPDALLIDLEGGTLSIDALPDGCRDVRLHEGPGIAVLVCGHGAESELWARTRGGSWRSEGRVGVPVEELEALSSAEDGTLVLHRPCACERDCTAFLRPPLAVGASWTELTTPGARLWRPVMGGTALAAITPDRADPEAFALVEVDAGGEETAHGEYRIEGRWRGLRVDENHVSVALEPNEWQVLSTDGGLTPVVLPRWGGEGGPTRYQDGLGCGHE